MFTPFLLFASSLLLTFFLYYAEAWFDLLPLSNFTFTACAPRSVIKISLPMLISFNISPIVYSGNLMVQVLKLRSSFHYELIFYSGSKVEVLFQSSFPKPYFEENMLSPESDVSSFVKSYLILDVCINFVVYFSLFHVTVFASGSVCFDCNSLVPCLEIVKSQ